MSLICGTARRRHAHTHTHILSLSLSLSVCVCVRWIEHGLRASACECNAEFVHMDMDVFVQRYRPLLWERVCARRREEHERQQHLRRLQGLQCSSDDGGGGDDGDGSCSDGDSASGAEVKRAKIGAGRRRARAAETKAKQQQQRSKPRRQLCVRSKRGACVR